MYNSYRIYRFTYIDILISHFTHKDRYVKILTNKKQRRILMQTRNISNACLNRLPVYLSYLRNLPKGEYPSISATTIARALDLGEVQVRKDLSAACGSGRPKTGYDTGVLISSLENYLKFNRKDKVILVGAGKLGKALLDYDGFESVGLSVIAAFDNDPSVYGKTENGIAIKPIAQIKSFCAENGVKIGIIAVPDICAQEVCDRMVESGISAIMNFAPVHLRAGDNVCIKNENIAANLALISKNVN